MSFWNPWKLAVTNVIGASFVFGNINYNWKFLPIHGFKGFNSDLRCRNYQYEVGKTFHCDGKIQVCFNGFHFCRVPTDVLRYYCEKDAKYAEVIGWNVDQHDDKCAAEIIHIVKEISKQDLYDWKDETIPIEKYTLLVD